MNRRERQQSERQRVPQPVIKKRIASGRGAMEQPNVTGDGDAALTGRFWIAVVVTGVATGLIGDLLMGILQFVERLAFNYHGGDYSLAVAASSPLRRVLSLTLAGIVGASAWLLIRRFLSHEHSDFDDAVWQGDSELGVRRSFLTSIVSEVVIGMGASVGREAAPKLMGGASGSLLSRWFHLTPAQKHLLVACGGGAGLACVYNVPLGGAIFTAEVVLGSFVATGTAYLTLSSRATYVDVPNFHVTPSLMVWSVVAGLVIGLLAVTYIRVIGWVSHVRASGARMLWLMPLTFALVGVIGIKYPQIFGNGKDMAHDALLGAGSIALFGILWALKPLVTAMTLGSGAAGGVFTPFMATGAVFGAFAGGLWNLAWPGTPIGAFAVVGAAAMIGSSMQAPLAGLVLVMELTHAGFGIMLPIMAATVIATAVSRHIDGYSIYSARLPRRAAN